MTITPKNAGESSRMYALRILKQNITDITLAPGTLLSENELADELGLSRVPVREALIELSQSKIIEILPQRGSRISLIDMDLVEESNFLRCTMECAVVRLACEKITPSLLLELEANLNLQKFYIKKTMPQKLMELDNEFHRLLFHCCQKDRCHKLVSDMGIHFDRIRSLALTAVKELKIVGDHCEIYEAVSRNNPDTAESLMRRHLSRFRIDKRLIKEKYPEYFKA